MEADWIKRTVGINQFPANVQTSLLRCSQPLAKLQYVVQDLCLAEMADEPSGSVLIFLYQSLEFFSDTGIVAMVCDPAPS